MAVVVLAAALLPVLRGAGEDQVASSAFLKGSEIFVRTPGSAEALQITSDGLKKGRVVLSKEGSRIAFIRATNLDEISCLVVVRPDGTVVNTIHFRPAKANIRGMRFVEDLEWISNDRLLVSGSVNPSIGEYAIVDVRSGKEVREYVVDGYSFAPSPDWSHVAYEAAIAHFTDEVDRHPQLCVDEDCRLEPSAPGGYPGRDRHVEFTTTPLWSPDGTRVDIVAQDYSTKAETVIVKQVGGKTTELIPPPEAGDGVQFSWKDNTADIHTTNGEWKLQPDRAGSLVWFRMK